PLIFHWRSGPPFLPAIQDWAGNVVAIGHVPGIDYGSRPSKEASVMKRALPALGLLCVLGLLCALNAAPAPKEKPTQLLQANYQQGGTHLVLFDLKGGDPKSLTEGDGVDTDHAWSHDGKKIAFTSTRNGARAIYVMDADGGNIKQLTKESDTPDRLPTWSP